MEQIKTIVNEVIHKIQQKQKDYPKDNITDIWVKVASKKLRQHTKVRSFHKGKLCVLVQDSAWLYDLKTKKNNILKKLQKASHNKIKDVIFKVGDVNGE